MYDPMLAVPMPPIVIIIKIKKILSSDTLTSQWFMYDPMLTVPVPQRFILELLLLEAKVCNNKG